MYILEIKINNKIKRIKNPTDVRIRDLMFIDVIQIKDDTGKWNNIFFGTLCDTEKMLIAIRINKAIEESEESICIYIN